MRRAKVNAWLFEAVTGGKAVSIEIDTYHVSLVLVERDPAPVIKKCMAVRSRYYDTGLDKPRSTVVRT